MSTSAPSRPNAAGAVPEDDLERFRAWLVGRGYAEGTALLWSKRVENAHAHGVEDPAAVDAAYPHLSHKTRSCTRAALANFSEFQEVTRCGGSS